MLPKELLSLIARNVQMQALRTKWDTLKQNKDTDAIDAAKISIIEFEKNKAGGKKRSLMAKRERAGTNLVLSKGQLFILPVEKKLW